MAFAKTLVKGSSAVKVRRVHSADALETVVIKQDAPVESAASKAIVLQINVRNWLAKRDLFVVRKVNLHPVWQAARL